MFFSGNVTNKVFIVDKDKGDFIYKCIFSYGVFQMTTIPSLFLQETEKLRQLM